VTQNGNMIKFPNPLLLNYTVLTHLRKLNGQYAYPLQVTLNYDIPMAKVLSKAKEKIGKAFRKRKFEVPEIVFFAKGMPVNTYASLNSALNTINVIVHFKDITEVNEMVDTINSAFDEAYWEVKKQAKQ